jgi:hypothetical protein
MNAGIDPSSVENLNLALRLYRRLLLRMMLICIGGIVIDILLVNLSTLLAPPYGVILLGEGLGVWGMIAVLLLLVAEIWVDGRAIGKALNDPLLQRIPALGLMSGLTLIAQRAQAMDMEWSGFLGPLRPAKHRR